MRCSLAILRREINTMYIIFLLSVICLYKIEFISLFSYIYTLTVFLLINSFLDKSKQYTNIINFHFYLFCCITIYLIQLYIMPNYLGLTGPENGIGTDDVRYYYQLSDHPLPFEPSVIVDSFYPYCSFLKILYPFSILSPLNILIPNLLGIAFLPYFINKISVQYLGDEKVGSLAEKLMLFCPFTISVGVILMRDIWIATFLIIALYNFLRKNYLLFIVFVFGILYIRFGSVAFLVSALFVLFKNYLYPKFVNPIQGKIVYMILLFLFAVIFIFSFPVLVSLSNGKLEESLFREGFASILMRMDEDATLLKIMALPKYLSIPLLSLFFLFSPFMSFKFYTLGYFNIRTILATTISPIMLIFCWKYILISFFASLKKSKIYDISLIVILFAICLGTISLQARHKTILMPFLYIMTAYGYYNRYLVSKAVRIICSLFTFCFFILQLYFILR